MGDLFEDHPDLHDSRKRLWSIIECTRNLNWLLLTKRPENIAAMAPWQSEWPPNVWLGVTAENQKRADERIPVMLSHNARVHFVSAEPLLGPLSLKRYMTGVRRLDWVIAGGESGPCARPSEPEWFRRLSLEKNATTAVLHSFSSNGETGLRTVMDP